MPEQNLQFDARHAVTVVYSAPVAKHRFVSWAGAHATDASEVQGVSELAGIAGKAGSVVTSYSYPVEAAAAIPAGSFVAPAGDGTGRAVVSGGSQCGRALTAAAAAGELVVVKVQLVAGGGVVSGAGIGPLSISAPDGTAAGDVLTATPNTGWTVASYQWTRDGVDINGATSSTYTLTLADEGALIGCRAGAPVYSALIEIPAGAYPAGYLSLDGGALSLDGGVLSIV